jgi:hypothetical protein
MLLSLVKSKDLNLAVEVEMVLLKWDDISVNDDHNHLFLTPFFSSSSSI